MNDEGSHKGRSNIAVYLPDARLTSSTIETEGPEPFSLFLSLVGGPSIAALASVWGQGKAGFCRRGLRVSSVES
jgi:hypothetical protein